MGLFGPAWKSKDENKALMAVKNETVLPTLEKISREALFESVRNEAHRKCQNYFFSIAKNKGNTYEQREQRLSALKNITDQELLIKLALEYDHTSYSEGAFFSAILERITDHQYACSKGVHGWEQISKRVTSKDIDYGEERIIPKNDLYITYKCKWCGKAEEKFVDSNMK